MKNLTILFSLLFILVLNSNAQKKKKSESKTGEFFIDFSEKPAANEHLFLDFSAAEMDLIWKHPAEGQEVTDKNISLRIGIKSDAEIKDIILTLNGVEVISRGIRVRGSSDKRYTRNFEQDVQLSEGGNIFKLTVVNINGQEATTEKNIIFTEKIVKGPERNDYAVLFATDDYDQWGDLTNPINDAETIAKELEEMYGFKVDLRKNPSREEILLTLREYSQKSYLENDQLMIFFAGHGEFDDLTGQGYIVTKESRKNDPAKTSYLSHAVLRGTIDHIPSQHTLLVMDVCFGGTFDPAIARAGSRGEDNMYSEISSTEFMKRKLRFKTRRYITSGGKNYVSDGRPGFHSPFASKFIAALRSYGGRDEFITLNELYGWLERINPEPRAGSFGTDAPGSDFVFMVKKK